MGCGPCIQRMRLHTQVAANLRASGLVLSQEEIERLEKLSALTPDHGASVIARGRVARQQYL